jgi:hypothetical protein
LPLKLNKLNEAKNEPPSCAKPDQRKKEKKAKKPEDKQIWQDVLEDKQIMQISFKLQK